MDERWASCKHYPVNWQAGLNKTEVRRDSLPPTVSHSVHLASGVLTSLTARRSLIPARYSSRCEAQHDRSSCVCSEVAQRLFQTDELFSFRVHANKLCFSDVTTLSKSVFFLLRLSPFCHNLVLYCILYLL